MTHPRRYALRMAVFLTVVAVVVVVLHEDAARFFMRNPPLNTLILSVLAFGIVLSFRTVLSLDSEVERIEAYRRDGRTIGPDPGPSLLGPLTAILEAPTRRNGLGATALRSILDGIDSRLDERRDTSRYLIALLIFLGLLGTFWGLLLTANSVGETIRGLNVEGSDPAQTFATLRTGLEAPLAGMGTAFSTSLFGLASSLVLGFLDLQASQAQNRFASELETWLSGSARFADDHARETGEAAIPSYVTALLQQAAENLDKLERRMSRTADDTAQLQQTLRTLIDDAARGRERAVDEIRNEIRLLARTLAAIADRER